MNQTLKNTLNYLSNNSTTLIIITFLLYIIFKPPFSNDKLYQAQVKLSDAQEQARISRVQADSLRTALQKSTIELIQARQIIIVSQQLTQQLELNYYKSKKSNPQQIDSLKSYLVAIQNIQKKL